ncbi:acyl carrier protein [Phycicoccus flavus]|uniref:Acyl carrier protein n=1 Tax=Phycicoccus flavus TaxID=2502783 RepID=A0A8T6R169_9MICO|nr:acyl carrier protein [Phycicoccus flavus]NHA67697.1 acyl carrier protein [Phycicoccus flavus]
MTTSPAVRTLTLDEVTDDLARIVGTHADGAWVAPDDNIFDLGVDSMSLVEIKEAVAEQLGVALTFSDFFTHFTVADLAAVVLQRAGEVSP